MKPEKMTDKELETALLMLEAQSGWGVKVRAHIAALTAERDALRERIQALEQQVSDEQMRAAIQQTNARDAGRRLAAIRQRAGDEKALDRVEIAAITDSKDVAREVARYIVGDDAPAGYPQPVKCDPETPGVFECGQRCACQCHAPRCGGSAWTKGGRCPGCPDCRSPANVALDAARLALMDSMLDTVRAPDESPSAALERVLRERTAHAPPSEAEAAPADVRVHGVSGANHPAVTEPTTAEAFDTVGRALDTLASNADDEDVRQEGRDGLDALSLLERRMGATARILRKVVGETREDWDGWEDGEGNNLGAEIAAALTDAPPVFTLEEVGEALRAAYGPLAMVQTVTEALSAMRKG